MKIVDRVGHVYGHLTVLARAENRPERRRTRVYWTCRCVCGAELTVSSNFLQTGHTTSCGCKGKGSVSARFMSMVEKQPSGCWVWRGAVAGEYGTFWLDGRLVPAHRAAVRVLLGKPLPAGHEMHVDHLCFNKLCVNPEHLELVTAAENIRRRDAGPRSERQQECAS